MSNCTTSLAKPSQRSATRPSRNRTELQARLSKLPALPSVEEVAKALTEQYLRQFIKHSWFIVEPGARYVSGWHIDAICLPAESEIITKQGTVQIGDIVSNKSQVEVLSFNHKTNEIEFKPIKAWMESKPRSLYEVELSNGNVLTITGNHPIFTKRGYIRADEVREGDVTLQVVRKRVSSFLISNSWWVLFNGVFRKIKSKTRNSYMSGLWRQESMGKRKVLSEVLCKVSSIGKRFSLSSLWKGCIHNARSLERQFEKVWSFLQPQMLRSFLYWREQSSIHRREIACGLSSIIRTNKKKGNSTRWSSMLSMLHRWSDGCSSYRSKQTKQRTLEFSNIVPRMPQSSKSAFDGGFAVSESFVVSIKRSLRIPETVYNIEVEDNNNYFVNSTLVHNCEHLQAVALSFLNDAIERGLIQGTVKPGTIRRLIINIPPRHMKSIAVAVMFPAWLWTRMPWLRFLFASYADTLSIRDSVKCRRLIQSDWYQSKWGALVEAPQDGSPDRRVILTGDQNQKTKFENTALGVRQATSVDGIATGEGGDAIIVDDPHNVKDAQAMSGKALENVVLWWDETMPTRLNDPKTGVKIIIMQRCHEKDLTGHILAKEHDYVHLCLPARFDINHKYFYARDPRTKQDEPLWKDKYDDAELKSLEKDMSSYAKAGQLQQLPSPREGGMLQRSWFEIVPKSKVPPLRNRVRWWDMAATKKIATNEPDYTAGARVGSAMIHMEGEDEVMNIYVEDVVSMRVSSLTVETTIKQTAQLDGRNVSIWMEQEPGSAGKAICETYLRKLIGYAFRYEPSTGAKEAFVEIMSAGAERGIVKLVGAEAGEPQPAWIEKFLTEAAGFPNMIHDDIVEAVAKAYCKITAKGNISIRVI